MKNIMIYTEIDVDNVGGTKSSNDLLKVLKKMNLEIKKFPLINYGYFVLKKGGNSGAVLNASNEVLVNAFLNHEIKYLDINKIIDKIMSTYAFIKNPSVEDLVKTDKEVRKLTKDLIEKGK